MDGGALVVALFVSCLRSGLFPFWVRAARPLVRLVFGCLGLSGPAGLARPVSVLPVPLVFCLGSVRSGWLGPAGFVLPVRLRLCVGVLFFGVFCVLWLSGPFRCFGCVRRFPGPMPWCPLGAGGSLTNWLFEHPF